MAERIQEDPQATGETETKLSPEVQRARELQVETRSARSLLGVELAKTHEKDSKYYGREDKAGKEAHRQIGWHIHRILQLDGEMELTEQVVSHILTGQGLWEARPEDIGEKLVESRKHHGLDI